MAQGLKIGSLLDHGKYRVECILGIGGFGITYLVTDLGLDKQRALKEFFPKDYCERDETTSHVTLGTSSTAEFISRLKKKFIKEARNIANLDQHSGIIRIHTVFEENNTAYYVMDYIKGESLSSIIKNSGPMQPKKAIEYITQIGEALSYVHSHKINHLDIKPANIMIRKRDDKPILIDFGLAKQYDSDGSETSTTPTGISYGFAPIEQYDPHGLKQFTPQTDVYSLAATLYYLLTGKIPPYATEIGKPNFVFPKVYPSYLYDAIKKGMSYDIESRPKTIRSFLDLLKPLSEKRILVSPVPTSLNSDNELSEGEESLRSDSKLSEKKKHIDSENELKGIANRSKREGPSGKLTRRSKENISISGEISPIPSTKIRTSKRFSKTSREVGSSVKRKERKYINPEIKVQKKSRKNLDFNKHRKKVRIWFYIILSILFFSGILIFLLFGNGDSIEKISKHDESDEISQFIRIDPIEKTSQHDERYETNQFIRISTSQGDAMYTGEVDADGLPNGHGVAKWTLGEAREYDGEWVHGKMEGQAKYTHSSGDTFVGTFKDNQYDNGRYTIASSGEYFVGSYNDGYPDKGKWYDKNGKEIQ